MGKLCFFFISFIFVFLREMPAEVMCCRFNVDGSLLAVGLSNGAIKVPITFIIKYMFLSRPSSSVVESSSCYMIVVSLWSARKRSGREMTPRSGSFCVCKTCGSAHSCCWPWWQCFAIAVLAADLSLLLYLFKVFASESGNCVYSLSDNETVNDHLPVTSIRWRGSTENTGNQLIATCKE